MILSKCYWGSVLGLLACFSLGTHTAQAQITPDGTLSTSVMSTDNLNFTIENGDTAGTNLFHSFGEFSVPTNGSAVFNNGIEIENIFGRVTGANISNIDGLIQANGRANLFLLNPNGIQFGSGASLNLGGSFFSSTADTLVFDDGLTFSTTDTSAAPLLSVNVPVGIQWNQPSPAPISAQNSALSVASGQTLTLMGGDIALSGTTLTAPGGQINVGGISTPGTVTLSGTQPSVPDGVSRSTLALSDRSLITVADGGGGTIDLQAQNLTLTESELQAGLAEGLGSSEAIAGSIQIDVTGDMVIDNRSLIANDIATGAVGDGGDITIRTGALSLTGGSRVQTVTNSTGVAGEIILTATGDINISGFTDDGLFSGILSRSAIDTSGKGGDITVNAPQGTLTLSERGFIGAVTNSTSDGGSIEFNVNNLVLTDGGQTVTATTHQGNAGNIVINATESVRISGESFDFEPNPFRELATVDLNVLDFITDANANVAESGSDGIPHTSVERTSEQIVSGTSILGTAVDGVDYYSFSVTQGGSRAILDVDDGFTGEAGSVDTALYLFNLATGELITKNDDEDATAGGEGSIAVFDTFSTDPFIDTTLSEAGVYVVGIGSFPSNAINNQLVQGAGLEGGETYTLQVSLENQGTDGVVIPDDPFNPDNYNPNVVGKSSVFSQSSGTGQGGNVTINTAQLIVNDLGQIGAEALATGDGGTITLDIADIVELSNEATIFSLTVDAGNAGNITLETEQLIASNRVGLLSSTSAAGNAGNIDVIARESVQLDTLSGINSFANNPGEQGDGGDITLETPILQMTNASTILTNTSGGGNAGNISIRANDIEVSGRQETFSSSIAADSFASGDGGTVTIDTERLTLADAGNVTVFSGGSGAGGSVTIRATDFIEISSAAGISSAATFLGDVSGPDLIEASGGDVTLITEQLRLNPGGKITALTRGSGDAGSITIQATEIDIDGSGLEEDIATGISVLVDKSATGNGGEILIEADRLQISNGGRISASTLGEGDAGNIVLAIDEIDVRGASDSGNGASTSRITASSETAAAAGSIDIITDTLRVSDRGTIVVSSLGGGEGGNLSIWANQIFLTEGGSLQAEVQQRDDFSARRSRSQNQGNIVLMIDDLLVMDQDALISARAIGTASGGNIAITAPLIVGSNNSDLVASAEQGNGGNIQISTESLLGFELRDRLTDENDITVSSEFGLDGTVEITDFNTDPDSGLVELSTGLVDASDQIAAGCRFEQGNTFVITGRGGLSPSPLGLTSFTHSWTDNRDLSALFGGEGEHGVSDRPTSPATAAPQAETTLTEASTWQTNSAGHLELIAVYSNQADINTPETCATPG